MERFKSFYYIYKHFSFFERYDIWWFNTYINIYMCVCIKSWNISRQKGSVIIMRVHLSQINRHETIQEVRRVRHSRSMYTSTPCSSDKKVARSVRHRFSVLAAYTRSIAAHRGKILARTSRPARSSKPVSFSPSLSLAISRPQLTRLQFCTPFGGMQRYFAPFPPRLRPHLQRGLADVFTQSRPATHRIIQDSSHARIARVSGNLKSAIPHRHRFSTRAGMFAAFARS